MKLLEEGSNIGLTFTNQVDATIGAMAVASLIDIKYSNNFERGMDRIGKIINRDVAISTGQIIPEMLYFGGPEKIGHTAMGLFFAFLILAETYISTTTWAGFAQTTFEAFVAILTLIHYAILGLETLEAVNHFLDILKEADDHDVLGYLWEHMSWQDWLILGGIFATLIALAAITAGSSVLATYALYAASLAYWATKLINDIDDCDDKFYETDSECPGDGGSGGGTKPKPL